MVAQSALVHFPRKCMSALPWAHSSTASKSWKLLLQFAATPATASPTAVVSAPSSECMAVPPGCQ
eukprot:13682402-Alexandrium_andersonii.AAC.1